MIPWLGLCKTCACVTAASYSGAAVATTGILLANLNIFGGQHKLTGKKRPLASNPRLILVRTILIILCVLAAILAGIYVFDRPRLERALSGTPLELPATTTKVFKWQDSEGNWHITDQPPAEGVKFEALNYRSNDNIMPLAPVDE